MRKDAKAEEQHTNTYREGTAFNGNIGRTRITDRSAACAGALCACLRASGIVPGPVRNELPAAETGKFAVLCAGAVPCTVFILVITAIMH